MLVLSRKENEQIVIGDNITLTISKVCGNRVRIAIDAPKDIGIRRGELLEFAPSGKQAGRAADSGSASVNVAAYHA